jgi:hypothetical protein
VSSTNLRGFFLNFFHHLNTHFLKDFSNVFCISVHIIFFFEKEENIHLSFKNFKYIQYLNLKINQLLNIKVFEKEVFWRRLKYIDKLNILLKYQYLNFL